MVIREYVECQGGSVQLTQSEAEASGVVILRGEADASRPVKVRSLHPLFLFAMPVDKVVIRRLDRYAEDMVFRPAGQRLDLRQP